MVALPSGARRTCKRSTGDGVVRYTDIRPILKRLAFTLEPVKPEVEQALKILDLTVNDLRSQWNHIQEKWEFVEMLCQLHK